MSQNIPTIIMSLFYRECKQMTEWSGAKKNRKVLSKGYSNLRTKNYNFFITVTTTQPYGLNEICT